MKKLIFYLILTNFAISSLFCQEFVTINAKEAVEQFILENELPITIGEEIIFQNYFNITDRINFQVFLMGLQKTLVYQLLNIFEYSISFDEILKNFNEINSILVNFNNYCNNNNYELAIIVFNNDFYFLNEYFEYFNYNITYHNNNWISLDNNTGNIELNNLIYILLLISDITKNNIINKYLYNCSGLGGKIYRKIVFADGKMEIMNIDIDYLDFNFETNLLLSCYYTIGNIICLLITRDYNSREIYETFWNEIIEKKMEMENEIIWGSNDDEIIKNQLLNYLKLYASPQ